MKPGKENKDNNNNKTIGMWTNVNDYYDIREPLDFK
jgi:hypothetical protein